jgi:hypothetical protein
MNTWKEIEYEVDGEFKNVKILTKMEVCSDCSGRGSVLTESIRTHAYTREELDEDPDFFEEYMKGGDGIYGVQCQTCRGKNVEEVVQWDNLCMQTPEILNYRDHVEGISRMELDDRQTYMMEMGLFGSEG